MIVEGQAAWGEWESLSNRTAEFRPRIATGLTHGDAANPGQQKNRPARLKAALFF